MVMNLCPAAPYTLIALRCALAQSLTSVVMVAIYGTLAIFPVIIPDIKLAEVHSPLIRGGPRIIPGLIVASSNFSSAGSC